MRSFIAKSLLTSTLFSLAAPAIARAEEDWNLNDRWVVVAEFLYWKREKEHKRTLVEDRDKRQCGSCPNFVVMSARSLDHRIHYEPGFRVGLRYLIDKQWELEAYYFNIHEWEASQQVTGNASLKLPFDNSDYAHDFVAASAAYGRYHSKVQGGELNAWYNITPRREDYWAFSGIFGVRYLNLHEKLNLRFTRGQNQSNYRVKTGNSMGGIQIGLDIQANPTRKLSWDVAGKAGILLNGAYQKTFLGDRNNSVVLRDFNTSRYQGTFLVSGSVAAAYQMHRHLNLHLGYEIIYLSGVAQAPEQVDKNTGGSSGKHLYDRGECTLHGLFVGCNFSF